MFIKTGDGKITHVIKTQEELAEEQKKVAEKEVEAKKQDQKSN